MHSQAITFTIYQRIDIFFLSLDFDFIRFVLVVNIIISQKPSKKKCHSLPFVVLFLEETNLSTDGCSINPKSWYYNIIHFRGRTEIFLFWNKILGMNCKNVYLWNKLLLRPGSICLVSDPKCWLRLVIFLKSWIMMIFILKHLKFV